MSLRTNTNRALKVARMTIAYGIGNWHLKRILKTRKEFNHERL